MAGQPEDLRRVALGIAEVATDRARVGDQGIDRVSVFFDAPLEDVEMAGFPVGYHREAGFQLGVWRFVGPGL